MSGDNAVGRIPEEEGVTGDRGDLRRRGEDEGLFDLRGGGAFRGSGCGPQDDAHARGRTTAGRLHRRDERPENWRRIVAAFARTPPIRQAHLFTAPIAGRPHRQVRDQLLAALAVHSAELGARRILVESCAQDTPDLAALTGALAHIGALETSGRWWTAGTRTSCCGPRT